MSEMHWVEPWQKGFIADRTALASFTSEASLLQPTGEQPVIPRGFFNRPGRRFFFRASGVFGTTGTPTLQWAMRLKTTIGTSQVDGTLVLQSAAITLGSGVTNEKWEFTGCLTCRIPGGGSGNLTLNADGKIQLIYSAADTITRTCVPTTGAPQTWTVSSALQNDVDTYVNLTATCSASDASNTITCKEANWYFW